MPIIDQCRDPYGTLSHNRRELLKRLLETPDQHLWEQARGLIIRAIPAVTLEQAVQAVCARTSIFQVPDVFTLYRALHFAIGYDSSDLKPEHGGICRK